MLVNLEKNKIKIKTDVGSGKPKSLGIKILFYLALC